MTRFEGIELHLQEGDVISSKLGILQESVLGKKHYLVKRLKYLGDGLFEVIGDKLEMGVKEVRE